ncbi:hypothetical protein [Thiomicrorhabdus sp.]|uniref:hypothetical protein n=1 Tax=Thiomicrorhabdus sp. TaxID=2039724 RepID=UPI0035693BB1
MSTTYQIPHFSILEKFKRDLTRKSKQLKKSQNIPYSSARKITLNELGWEDGYQFQQWYKAQCRLYESIENSEARKARVISSSQSLDASTDYFFFKSFLKICDKTKGITHNKLMTNLSSWVATHAFENAENAFYEIRSTRTFSERGYKQSVVDCFIDSGEVVYLLNNYNDILNWLINWGGHAVIPEDIVPSEKIESENWLGLVNYLLHDFACNVNYLDAVQEYELPPGMEVLMKGNVYVRNEDSWNLVLERSCH